MEKLLLRRAVVLLFAPLLALPLIGAAEPSEPLRLVSASADLVVATYDYAGTGDPDQTLDAYTDPAASAAPWVVTVHGGSWAAGSKANTDKASRAFAAEGFQVFNVAYRLTSDYRDNVGAAWPAQRDDILMAIAWIKSRADQFGINPDRGAIYGFSAGGHIAASVGLYGNGSERVQAIVSASGALQPDRIWNEAMTDGATSSVQVLAGWAAVAVRCPLLTTWADCGDRWWDFRPDKHISAGDPPVMLFQGTADPAVPPATAPSFAYWLRKGGVEATLTECVGWTHTEACAFDGGWRQAQMMTFLKAETA